ncbi:hypothetical protein TorRG33x02_108230 [Trema orientale]|uniref:Uncharacterized protein n=1 Tax=Trema orientale TaxID=63057 RepID=A0A2P5F641_TREOI|nr:hypothetical protein TorRG33x02_108230 [Trema orientale]
MLKHPFGSELPSLVPCPPDNSRTANFPSEIAFNPIFHHLSLSSSRRSSTVDTLPSGTGSIAAVGRPWDRSEHRMIRSILERSKLSMSLTRRRRSSGDSSSHSANASSWP